MTLDVFGDPQFLEDPHDFMVEVRRAWQRIDFSRAVDGEYVDSGVADNATKNTRSRPAACVGADNVATACQWLTESERRCGRAGYTGVG